LISTGPTLDHIRHNNFCHLQFAKRENKMKYGKHSVMSNLQRPRTKVLMGLLVCTLVLVVANLVLVNIYSAEDQVYIQKTSDMRVLSQEMARHATGTLTGSATAFSRLEQSRNGFDSAWTLISAGQDGYVDSGIGYLTALPGRNDVIMQTQPEIGTLWSEISANAALVLSNQERMQTLNQIAASVAQGIPQLQRDYEEVVSGLLDNDEPFATIAVAQRQAWLLERIALNLNRIISGGADAAASLEQFQRDISLFSVYHEALTAGDSSLGVSPVSAAGTRATLNEIRTLFTAIEADAATIIAGAPEITRTSAAVDKIVQGTELLLVKVTLLSEYFTTARGNHVASPFVGYMLLMVILVLISLYGFDMIMQSRKSGKVAEEINQRNNAAVMKLLEEISDLGDGDLTVKATVSEDFTGAIADAINYAVSQLRGLVSAINNVSVDVAHSTKKSEETVKYLAEASERQSQSIGSVSESVRDMERSISRVADNAQKSLLVAKDSVSIAAGGADVVKNTIKGMDTIREQIQETAKRIKRLGESSQEIGSFVALINDIADHTNTLSLNAAIQAAMAGEAGRGFAVVADEVHALAERSSDATRQIESLVKVIQRDINEAVFSMEQTTSEVVQGTKLAQNAGIALDDIESVSKELASLVENIAEAARNQERSASEITNTMETIQQITTETSSGTRTTSEFVVKLTGLTERLRSAVAGFSLSRKSVGPAPTEIYFEESAVLEMPVAAQLKKDHSSPAPRVEQPDQGHAVPQRASAW
jgi:twitching motility protein PilJ